MVNIRDLKNVNKGEDIFILANAPSIKKNDLSRLKGKVVIGMNANPLLEKEFGFVSDYYVVSDLRFITHPQKRPMATEMLDKKTKRVFRQELMAEDQDELKDKTYYIKSLGRNGFSCDLEEGYYFGVTTTMLAVQLAAYLGAKNIYILGMDLKYKKGDARFYHETSVQEYDKFTSTQIYNVQNAYKILKENDVNLYNCSKTSLLFPYLPFIDFNKSITKG